MNITLRDIDKNNWMKCCTQLEVHKHQEGIVAPNWNSILCCVFLDNWHSKCVYLEEEMVGYIMYGREEETGKIMLLRYIIDKKYQGRGIGKEAIRKLLDIIRITYSEKEFYTTVCEGNEVAERTYSSIGFKRTGEIMWEENVMKINL